MGSGRGKSRRANSGMTCQLTCEQAIAEILLRRGRVGFTVTELAQEMRTDEGKAITELMKMDEPSKLIMEYEAFCPDCGNAISERRRLQSFLHNHFFSCVRCNGSKSESIQVGPDEIRRVCTPTTKLQDELCPPILRQRQEAAIEAELNATIKRVTF